MPATVHTALDTLRDFLNKLFQFESQDLDFGIYKILHYKRAEIKRFIDQLLVEEVKTQLRQLSDKQTAEAEKELHELAQNPAVSRWLEAKAKHDTTRIEIYEADYKADIRQYTQLERIVQAAQAAGQAETLVYNHLSLFFSRYYDRGDFISKRRFGKNEKYMVPYNGEETHFHWANHDQYYIKSAEHFRKYAFKVPHAAGTLTVHFKLTDADTEQGNVKADESRYFIPAQTEPEFKGDELTVFFQYRALTETEKKELAGQNKQDKLDEHTAAALEAKLKTNHLAARLWERPGEQTVLLTHLRRYTRKNNHDFFIHKDLEGFLQRELDFYIKSELVNVDDLYVLDTEVHFDRLRQHFKTIKVFKHIADTIISFLAQIERFQKKLWEKKKFVLGTHYVITLDRLVAWAGQDAAKPLIAAALDNAAQVAEWKQLFGEAALPRWENLQLTDVIVAPEPSAQTAIAFAQATEPQPPQYRKLPLDTAHFGEAFKWELLNVLSEKINLEEKSNGLVLHSDNYHGLVALQEKYREQIRCIYIDPPYNTDASEIIYKNGFRSSSWISLIENRLALTKDLLCDEGILCATIDDFQQKELSFLIEKEFSRGGIAGTVIIRNNPSGRPTQTGFALAHEYGIFARKSEKGIIGRTQRSEEQLGRFNEKDDRGVYEVRNLRREGSNSEREKRRKLYYPI